MCTDYDNEASCTNISNIKCTWEVNEDDDEGSCRAAGCVDIVDKFECMETRIANNDCYYWMSLDTCDVDICDNRGEEQCFGFQSNGANCYWDGQCRTMSCADYKYSVEKARIAALEGDVGG